ncbi:hypothetical protein AB9K26_03195 [Psychroserpens sp. XS_ASV72]|uniref:hypothetical protein n=1 Tax=Psychroserpens sp. XS_ASV72 TaxID=3241293 RepID=UPI0035184169
MKNIIKIIPILLLVFVVGCDQSDSRFRDDPTSGWVEFFTAATTTGQTASSVTIPVEINVPVYENGLNITYTITAVEGDFTQFVSSSGGTLFVDPTVINRSASITIPLMNMDLGRNFVTSFDVTITDVNVNTVGIGVDDSSVTAHRVTIPCSNPDVLPADYFVGDYMIADVAATIGPGNGTSNMAPGTVTLTVDPNNPNVRLFSSPMVPAFTGGTPFSASLSFSEDDYVTLGGYIGLGISCNGADEYGFTGAAAADSGPWDVCNDQTITIQYTEDPNGSCGGPFPSSFSLTRL